MIRFLTAGESHGPSLTAIIEGVPAGLNLSAGHINTFLERRQGGYGRGGRMKIEKDRVKITSGVRGGITLGSPITLVIENKDWANWKEIMHAEHVTEGREITRPRPGHADLPGGIKYRHADLRNILERASARETAARVAAGAVCSQLLASLGIRVASHVVQIGPVKMNRPVDFAELAKAQDSAVYCVDREVESQMIAAIDKAKKEGDTLGGIFEIQVQGVPVGLGSHVQWDRRLDGQLAQALMSIQAIKAVEIGSGLASAGLYGSQVHDEIFYEPEKGFYRKTNFAGGLEGGISNGQVLVVRAAMKPIPTLMRPLASADFHSKEPFLAAVERSDVCAVPAASVVGETAVATVLASAVLEKFGGDHLVEIQQNLKNYQEYVRQI